MSIITIQFPALAVVSKLIEKIVAKQLKKHILTECLSNIHQSAYQCFYCTEIALKTYLFRLAYPPP